MVGRHHRHKFRWRDVVSHKCTLGDSARWRDGHGVVWGDEDMRAAASSCGPLRVRTGLMS